ncbi:MAG: hypothetical protein ABIP39_02950, partial [Polyangiaceae bacterium]
MTTRASLSLLCVLLLSGCAHDPPPRTVPTEEPVVLSGDSAAKPIPAIDPAKPLVHAGEIR